MSTSLALRFASDAQIAQLIDTPLGQRFYLLDSEVDGDASLDLGDAWNGLHFLFTGTERGGLLPASSLLSGGQIVGPSNVCVEMDRALTSAETSLFSRFLSGLAEHDLIQRFDPDQMGFDVYPGGWDDDPEEQFTTLVDNFNELKQFVSRAAADGMGLVIYFN